MKTDIFEKIERACKKIKTFFTKISQKIEENKFLSKVVKWMKKNRMFLIYALFAILIEIASVWTVEGDPFMSRPFLALGALIAVGSLILFIPNDRVRMIVYGSLLGLQGIVDIGFIIVYDLTGQYFDYGMLNLRNDAASMIESLPVNFFTFYVSFFLCAVYVAYGLRTTVWKECLPTKLRSVFFRIGASVVGIAMLCISFVSYYPIKNVDKYKEMVEGTAQSEYSAYGIVGNLVGEFTSSLFKDKSKMPDEEIEKFIYASDKVSSKDAKYFGVAEGKNVVMVLAESLEWFAFMQNEEDFGHKNGLDLDEDMYKTLFPTLHRLYNEAVVMNNFHAREKTDTSETMSIMGSYPTEGYVNYDYSKNAMLTTLPNVLNTVYGEDNIRIESYHNGFKTFYNRDEVHPKFGFEKMTDMYDMADESKIKYQEAYNALKNQGKEVEEITEALKDMPTFTNHMNSGERNLDAEMVNFKKEEMFPTNERFYTYLTMISMHGVYYERKNLERESALFEDVIGKKLKPELDPDRLLDEEEHMQAVLYHYMTTALEFEEAMATLFDYLEKTPDKRAENQGKMLIDTTTVVVFSDHNAYYHNLSNFVKGIEDNDFDTEDKYTELYNVPFMIYDTDLIKAVGEEDRVIEKFTCTADIVPTLLDLLGIRYYTNMYYGNSVFAEEKSVLYSRAYGQFISDGILGRTVNDVSYVNKALSEADVEQYKTTATALVEKIRYCDQIFRQNYFGGKGELYKENLRKLQELE